MIVWQNVFFWSRYNLNCHSIMLKGFSFKRKAIFGDNLFSPHIGVFPECDPPAIPIKKQIRSSVDGIKVRLKPTQHSPLMEEIPVDTAGISRGRDWKACWHQRCCCSSGAGQRLACFPSRIRADWAHGEGGWGSYSLKRVTYLDELPSLGLKHNWATASPATWTFKPGAVNPLHLLFLQPCPRALYNLAQVSAMIPFISRSAWGRDLWRHFQSAFHSPVLIRQARRANAALQPDPAAE